MHGCLGEQLNALALVLASTPMKRLDAIQRHFSTGGGTTGTWIGVVLGVLVIVGIGSVIVVSVMRNIGRRNWRGFKAAADGVGLSEEERTLLARIASSLKLKDPVSIFTSESLFERGMTRISSGTKPEETGVLSKSTFCGTCIFSLSLREKLGFHLSDDLAGVEEFNLGPIGAGARLNVIRRGSPSEFEVTVVAATPEKSQLDVRLDTPVPCRQGETWIMRMPRHGIVWEFNAWVTFVGNTEVTVKPIGNVRLINRRRFVRVPTGKKAFIAVFPFHQTSETQSLPSFIPATMTELGGPGVQLKIDADISVEVGDRSLVILHLNPEKIIESSAVIRRVDKDDQGRVAGLAVELVGLNTAEVDELVAETNALTQHNAEFNNQLEQQEVAVSN